MKRSYLFILTTFFFGFFLTTIPAHAGYIAKSLWVRVVGQSSYNTSASIVSNGSSIEIQLGVVVNAAEPTTNHRANFSLPSGFTGVSYTVTSSTCTTGPTNITQDPNYFSFDFTPSGATCSAIVSARYTTVSVSTGTITVNGSISDSNGDAFWNGNDIVTSPNSLTLTVTSFKTLVSGGTLDLDLDGYIDALKLTFDSTLASYPTASDFSVLTNTKTASGLSFSGALWSTQVRLLFNDDYITTAEVPRVVIGNNATYTSGSYFWWVMNDTAGPYITVTPNGGTYTGSVSVTMASNESGSIYYSLTAAASTGSTVYTGSLTFTSATTLYALSLDSWGYSGSTSKTFSFQCAASAPANGSISAYPGCAISCNAGYTLSGNSCVVAAGGGGWGGGWGGGGGGGWTTTTTTTTTSSGTSSGGWTPGGTSSGTSTSPVTDGIVPNTWNIPLASIDSLFLGTLDSYYFSNIKSAETYVLSKLSSPMLLRQAKNTFQTLNFSDHDYYVTVDQSLANNQLQALNAAILYYLRSQERLSGDRSIITYKEITGARTVMQKWIREAKAVTRKYVLTSTKLLPVRVSIYKTKVVTLKTSLTQTERIVFWKLNSLYRLKKLSKDEYISIVAAYNGYALHATLYELTKHSESKKRRDYYYEILKNKLSLE